MTETKIYSIKTISPIHIGSGEDYEPMGFAVNEDGQELIVFDPMTFHYSLDEDEQEKYFEICRKGTISSIMELYKFIRLKKEKISGRAVKVCSGFIEHYELVLDIPTNNESKIKKKLNKFRIERLLYVTNDERPYIPGSSIKGSLRTAYLNMKSREKGEISYKRRDELTKNLEKDLLDGGSFQTDPFRMLKVSDFHPVADKVKTRIVYAVNVSKDPLEEPDIKSLFQILEVIEPGSVFMGHISLEKPERGADIKTPLVREKVFKSASEFYGSEKSRENNELSRINIPGLLVNNDKKGVLLRLGHHSGAESVTIEGYRHIMIKEKGGGKKYLDRATTFWLASEHRQDKATKKTLLPFGWVLVEELDEITAKNYEEKEKEYKVKRDREQSEIRKREQEAIDKEFRLRKEIEEKERARLEEEAKRKAELEAMPPEEKDIVAVRETSTYVNIIYEIYGRIDNFSVENKVELARALQERWKKEKKWEGKMSDKQRVRVQKLKDILSED